MASSFPGAIDSFTDPLSNSSLASPSHSTLHSDINDAVEKVEQYMGLVKVIPTSVSSAGGTAATLNSTTGTVTIGTTNTSVTVGGCFSALYDHYRLVITINAQSLDGYCRIQYNNDTTANYYDSAMEMTYGATTVTGVNAQTQTVARIGRYTAGLDRAQFSLDVFAPFQAARTWGHGQTSAPGYFSTHSHQSATTNSNTGFILTPSAGTWTGGSIRVYGYRN